MKANKQHFVLLGGAADFGHLEGDTILDAEDGDEAFWTVLKSARSGDVAFIYITSPISSIVARCRIADEPFLNMGLFPDWSGHYMARIEAIKILPEAERVSIKRLRELFAKDWAWLNYPRQNTRIPDDVVPPFLELFETKHTGVLSRKTPATTQ